MAEGLLSGILGEDDEKPEVEATEAVASAGAFAAAVAARLSASDPQVAQDTSAFLKKQTQLLETQNKHLGDEHALRLAHLREQSHLLRGQRLSQGIRITFQIATALIASVIGVGIVVMVHDAFNSRSVPWLPTPMRMKVSELMETSPASRSLTSSLDCTMRKPPNSCCRPRKMIRRNRSSGR
jgi:hypothetical protein